MRKYCRSTRAHNTVEIDGRDQCEFWSAFRVARRGYPCDIIWKPASSGFCLSGWHDGYRWLQGGPTHHRTVVWGSSKGLEVRDRVKARRPVTAVSRLHLHPDCRIISLKNQDVIVEYSAGTFKITFSGQGKLYCENSFYCPEFGYKVPNIALAYKFDGKESETIFTLVSQ